MPLYEYYCRDCRSKFELLTTYTESEVDIECAKCHGPHVRKMFSVFARPRSVSSDFGGDFDGGFGGEGDFGDEGEFAGGASCGCGAGGCGCHD
jgi:putative FmdB family regulatory protein